MDSLWREFVLNSERENRIFLCIFRLGWTFVESNLEAGFNFLFCLKLHVHCFHGCSYTVEFCLLTRTIKLEFEFWHQYLWYFLMMIYFCQSKSGKGANKEKNPPNRYNWLVLALHHYCCCITWRLFWFHILGQKIVKKRMWANASIIALICSHLSHDMYYRAEKVTRSDPFFAWKEESLSFVFLLQFSSSKSITCQF